MKKEATYAGYAIFLFARAASRELVERLRGGDVPARRRRGPERRRSIVPEPALDEATAELLG
jgi:hypothetical protein